MWRFLALFLVVVGCGSSPAEPDGGRDGSGQSLCEGKPCLTAIDDDSDWELVAADFDQRCGFDQVTKYLAPAASAAVLRQTVYQDVKVHRFHLEFMQQVLSGIFGGLPADTYYEMVQHRATRQYFAGAIYRVTDGTSVLGYGFDVIIDPTDPDEQLREDEIQAIGDLLDESFALSLGYAPLANEAIVRAREFDSLTFPIYLPRVCPGEECADPEKNCFVVPDSVSACGVFQEGRAIEKEYQVLTRLDFMVGAWELPREAASDLPMTLFNNGAFGPDRVPIVPSGTGNLTVMDEGTWLRYIYEQELAAAGDTIALTWELYAPKEESRQFTVAEPWLSTDVHIYATVNDSIEYDDMLRLGSCTYEGLDTFHADGVIAGGDGFELTIRHQTPMAGSGPLNVVAADVRLGGIPFKEFRNRVL